jgi:aspartate aminotransferase-like enzyme
VPDVLNMSVGQTDLHPVYRDALIAPIDTPAYFTGYKDMYAELLAMLRTMLGTAEEPVVVLGTGRTGLEVGVYSTVAPDDRVLSIDNGHWGHFLGDLAANVGAKVSFDSSGAGRQLDWARIEKTLRGERFDVVTIAHCETNTGALYDIRKLREVIDRVSPETLLIVDGISAFGSTPVRVDEWGVDCYVGGSQKCLNASQGTPVVAFSARARDRARTIASTRPYLHTLDPTHKPCFLLIRSLHALLRHMLDVGLDTIYARHTAAAGGIRAGLSALGLETFVQDADLYSPSVTRIVFPAQLQARIDRERTESGIDQDVVTQTLMTQAGVVIGEDRIGTMGFFTQEEHVDRMIAALGEVLAGLGHPADVPAARRSARDAFRADR